MSQQVNDNFQLLAGLPLDDRTKKATIAERDSIDPARRFQGLKCFVQQTQTDYILLGGISNSNWVGVSGANVSNALETIIEGFYVLSAGKEALLDWEVGDKFRGWIGTRYLVGTIISLPVSLPSDIDNVLKVELAFDSDALNNLKVNKQNNLKKINVEFYGAVGDGVTDNTTALNALFSDSLSNGAEIVFPKGNYIISDLVTVNYPCVISGSGGVKITQTNGAKGGFFIDSDDVSITDIYVDNSAVSVTIGDGIALNKAGRCILTNVFVFNFYKNINIINGGGWQINGCVLYDAVLYNLHIQNIAIPDEGDSSIMNSYFYAGKSVGTIDIYQQSGGGLKMVNTKFNKSGVNLPIHHYYGNFNQNTSILLFNNNSFEHFDTSSIKIRVASGKTFSQVNINGNQFSSETTSLKPFIDIDGTGSAGLSHVSVQNNVFATNVANTDPVVKITNAGAVAVSGNNSNAVNTELLTGCTDVKFQAMGMGRFSESDPAKYAELSSDSNYSYFRGNGAALGTLFYNVNGKPIFVQPFGGNFVIGSVTDDGINALQVDGDVKILGLSGTGTRQVGVDSTGKLLPVSMNQISSTEFKTLTPISHTGTTSYTRLIDILLPANSIATNSVWKLYVCGSRGNTSAVSAGVISVDIDNSTETNDFVRGVAIGTGANSIAHIERTIQFTGGNMIRFSNSGAFYDDLQSAQVKSTTAFDNTIDNHLFAGLRLLDASDTYSFDYIIFKRID